jgi:hypothetical protein
MKEWRNGGFFLDCVVAMEKVKIVISLQYAG